VWIGPERAVFVIQEPVDMRKSIDGLAALVAESWGDEPLRDAVFVGFNKGRDAARCAVEKDLFPGDRYTVTYAAMCAAEKRVQRPAQAGGLCAAMCG
jgi:hypothetical protein